MNYTNLKNTSSSTVKALFGLHPTVLAELLFKVLPELERRRTARLARRPERKRAPLADDGRPREVTPLHKTLMTLLYLRHNVSHTVIGALFGHSADSSENAFHELLPVLRDLFPKEKWEAEKRHRSQPQWTPDEVERLLLDSFETPVARPSLHERQKRLYSGKKKRHTLKTQIITDQTGEILDVSRAQRGPIADVKLYEQTPLPEPLKDKPRLGDKAYVGAAPAIQTPHKKPRGGTLTEAQKAENRCLSSQRVRVEHGIRRVKGFRITRDDYRLAVGLFSSVVSAVVGLLQFSRIVG
jgi:DDE superfamily endonuclease/Helix-turn-helix of DDE superfamily endonuclease